MILYINTADNNLTLIGLKDKGRFIFKKEFKSYRRQSEKLLPEIEKLLEKADIKLKNLKGIEVASFGDSFTALRIGILTANALAYALNIPIIGDNQGKGERPKKVKKISIVAPVYSREPNIT